MYPFSACLSPNIVVVSYVTYLQTHASLSSSPGSALEVRDRYLRTTDGLFCEDLMITLSNNQIKE
jgi:hypothetical protein